MVPEFIEIPFVLDAIAAEADAKQVEWIEATRPYLRTYFYPTEKPC